MKKIALLFFGQLRHLSNPNPVISHKNNILDVYDVDIFSHAWKTARQSNIDQHKASYSFNRIEIDEPLTFEDDATILKDRLNIRSWSNNWHEQPNNLNNLVSHFYSIQRVGNILKEYIVNTGTHYDHIVLSRSDLIMLDFPDLDQLDPSKFYISNQHPRFPDLQIILGMKHLSFLSMYNYIRNITDESIHSLWTTYPEAFKYSCFTNVCDVNDLTPIHLPCMLVRSETCAGI